MATSPAVDFEGNFKRLSRAKLCPTFQGEAGASPLNLYKVYYFPAEFGQKADRRSFLHEICSGLPGSHPQMKRRQRSLPARPRSGGNGSPSEAVRPNGTLAAQFRRLSTRMDQMEGELDHIKSAWDRMGTSRQGVREQIEKNGADLSVQFQRIAMMQAEVDRLKANETALQTEIDQLRTKNRQQETMSNERRRRSNAVRPSAAEDRKGPAAAVTEDAICGRAYQLYEARGGEPGADLDDRLRAARTELGMTSAVATRVLLVDDDRSTLDGVAEYLRGCGFDVLLASTGQQALTLAMTCSPAVVVLDLGLPDIDGWEVARQLRASSQMAAVPIIALTGSDLPHERVSAMHAGCDRHLAKPCAPADLLDAIRRSLPEPA